MSADQFESQPRPLVASSPETRQIAKLLQEKVVGDYNMFEVDGQFRLIEPKATRITLYTGEPSKGELHMWAPGLLQYDPAHHRLSTDRRNGLLEVRNAHGDMINMLIYKMPVVASIMPSAVRFVGSEYFVGLGESGYLLKPPGGVDDPRIIHGFYDRRGIIEDPTPNQVDEEVTKAAKGERPNLFSKLAFIKIDGGYKPPYFKVIELKIAPELATTDDCIVLHSDGFYTNGMSLVSRRMEYPLKPQNWGLAPDLIP